MKVRIQHTETFFRDKWYLVVIGIIFFLNIGIIFVMGENCYITVWDNLDSYVAYFKLLENNNVFFSSNINIPILNGIGRNYFPSELNLYNLMYFIFPTFEAYIIGHFLGIIIGFSSSILLARFYLKDKYSYYKPIVYIISFSYGMLPLYPATIMGFMSLPLLIYVISKIYQKSNKFYFVLLIYPMLSNLPLFGIIIEAFLVFFAIICWGRKKYDEAKRIAISVIVLGIGYLIIDWRLVECMIFSNDVSLRKSIVRDNASVFMALSSGFKVWINGIPHANSLHKTIALPSTTFYFICNLYKICKKIKLDTWEKRFNLIFIIIMLNSFFYGMFSIEKIRSILYTLIPPLDGWDFSRTVWFNPFLWYAGFFLSMKKLYDKRLFLLSNLIAITCLWIIIVSPVQYNDVLLTVKSVWSECSGGQVYNLNYKEFYSEELFRDIKEALAYKNEKSVAFGIHPAVLQYNDIFTLDGYLSYYPQSYKDEFRNIINPLLQINQRWKKYYDDWGGRAYVFDNTLKKAGYWQTTRKFNVEDNNIYIDSESFKNMGGVYVFSRVEIANALDKELDFVGAYENEDSWYVIYVYKIIE